MHDDVLLNSGVSDVSGFSGSPGVYKMIDSDSRIIYVGKAKNLRKRISSYFRPKRGGFLDFKTSVMVSWIYKIETIVTTNELEALILESNLIKKHRPKYNVLLKDDKTYPYIAVSVGEDYPRVFKTRSFGREGYRYYGPFTDEFSINKIIRLFNRVFRLRVCRDAKFLSRKRPCLYHDMDHCSGICCGKISVEDYRENVEKVIAVLEGKSKEILCDLKKKIVEYSSGQEFEKAAVVRDEIRGIEQIYEKQVISFAGDEDMDVVGVFGKDGCAVVEVLFIRKGLLVGDKHFFLEDVLGNVEVMSEFICRFYSDNDCPKLALTSEKIGDSSLISEWLGSKKGGRIVFRYPLKGDKKKLTDMAVVNAQNNFCRIVSMKKDIEGSLCELKDKLGLDDIPKRIHAFDISTIQGSDSVGSMVSFVDGVPAKGEYRRFKIRSVSGQNDFLMMKEVLYRQYSKNPLPDLILIDGGKGQLGCAVDVLNELGCYEQPVISLAKRMEEVYVPSKKNPVGIDKNSKGGYLLQRIRDEAHRFAVGYHRVLRSKRALS